MALIALLLAQRLDHPLGVRPDSWSEAEVIVSGWGYARDGFLAHWALPQHQVGPPLDPYFLYANYPVLSNVTYGVLHRAGADAHGLYRLPPVLCSLLALWLWYRLLGRLVDRVTATAATLALGSSFGFLAYADTIHQQAYPLGPQLVYLYRLMPPSRDEACAALRRDPLLRAILTGSPTDLGGEEAERRALAAMTGQGNSFCPIVLAGADWIAFDLSPIVPLLRRELERFPMPTLKDLPPPR